MPHRCASAAGTITDLTTPPRLAGRVPTDGWTTRSGCPVRLDVLTQFQGAGHCGWESASTISTAATLGHRANRSRERRYYVRDPLNVYRDEATSRAFDADAELPSGARDTGFRRRGVALWMKPGDPAWIYLVDKRRVDRWPLDPEPSFCA